MPSSSRQSCQICQGTSKRKAIVRPNGKAEDNAPNRQWAADEHWVDPKLRSVAILAAVRECEAAYVWSARAGAARRNGLAESVIDVLRAKGDPSKLGGKVRDIVTYVRQLMQPRQSGGV